MEENDDISFQSTGLVEYTHEPEQNDNLQESEKNNHHLCINTSNEEQTMVTDWGSVTHDFSLEIPNVIPDEREPKTLSAQDELLRWHYCLNHLPFKRLLADGRGRDIAKEIITSKTAHVSSMSTWQNALETMVKQRTKNKQYCNDQTARPNSLHQPMGV